MLNRTQRARQIARVLWITLALNWAIALAKVLFGTATRCQIIVADGLHSFSDGASNIAGLIAVYVAGRPPDEDHPYGHQKYETFASVFISFLLLAVAFSIVREAVAGLFHPRQPEVNLASFMLMLVTLVVNVSIVLYERRMGKRLKSDLLMSDSWHTLTDAFTTSIIFVALFGIYHGITVLDSLFSFIVAGIILVTAFKILKSGSDVLLDRIVMDTEPIETIVKKVPKVRDCHEIRTRGRRDSIYVDLHVLVDPEMSVQESHSIANVIERDIRAQIPGVYDVVVHIEPTTHDHGELDKA